MAPSAEPMLSSASKETAMVDDSGGGAEVGSEIRGLLEGVVEAARRPSVPVASESASLRGSIPLLWSYCEASRRGQVLAGSRRQPTAIGRDGDGRDPTAMALERLRPGTGRRIPDPDGMIAGSRRQPVPIGRDSNGRD